MADDPHKRGPADRLRVALEQDHEVAYWTHALETTKERLSEAVAAVGHMVDDVRQWLHEHTEP